MIIFNLDGTLADCSHRQHLVDCKKFREKQDIINVSFKPNWKAFYEACDMDLPIRPTIEILRKLTLFREDIEIWSGRCESVREKTEKWIIENIFGNNDIVLPVIRMCPIGDYTPDDELKERWFDEALAEGKKIDFVFDDSEKCCNMWRRHDIFTFYVNQT